MFGIEIKPDIFYIGVNDRTTDLFEGLWPITKEGVSYNSYLVMDEKKAIIDLVKSLKVDEYLDHIGHLTEISGIDYIVINHLEPDHSSLLRIMRRINPGVTLIGSAKAADMLAKFYGIKDNVKVVSDGDTLNLGRRTLRFLSTPFLHWPETIMTYEATNRVLFTCDAFGSYGAIRGAIFDDDCKSRDFYLQEALRYYVNIVANFSSRVLSAIEKVKDIPVDIIAPSHGLIWRKNIHLIVGAYKKWAESNSHQTFYHKCLFYYKLYVFFSAG